MNIFSVCRLIVFLIVILPVSELIAQQNQNAVADTLPLNHIVLHPVHEIKFTSNDHSYGQFRGSMGDELGKDVLIIAYDKGPDNKFPAFYRTDGITNEDWYGWDQKVLAPFSGKVVKVFINEQVNQPGIKGDGRASIIIFEREDGVNVVYAHVQNILVKEGDEVDAGQHVANVGNNGYSWMPHIHIGAYKGNMPLQIIFDLKALGKLYGRY